MRHAFLLFFIVTWAIACSEEQDNDAEEDIQTNTESPIDGGVELDAQPADSALEEDSDIDSSIDSDLDAFELDLALEDAEEEQPARWNEAIFGQSRWN